MPRCIVELHQAQAKAAAQSMGWPVLDDGGCVRVELPEDWAGEIVGCIGLDLDVALDFAAGIRRAGSAENVKQRLESQGLLG